MPERIVRSIVDACNYEYSTTQCNVKGKIVNLWQVNRVSPACKRGMSKPITAEDRLR